MGHQITYCASCGNKILDRDFQSRAAFRLDSRAFCKQCAPEALKSLPPDKMTEVLAQISQAQSSPQLKVPARQASSKALPASAPSTRRQVVAPSRTGLIVAAAGGGGVLIGLLIWALSGSSPPPPPPPPPPKETAADRPPKIDREALAAKALRLAREYRAANPREFATQIASVERLMSDFAGTRAADEARRDLDEIRRLRDEEALQADLRGLQEKARGAATGEEIEKTVAMLKESRARRPDVAWTQGVDRLVQETLDRKPAPPPPPPPPPPPSGRRSLIGTDLSAWDVTKGRWEVKEGILQAVQLDNQNRTFIMLREELGDFELEGMLGAPDRAYTEIAARGNDFRVDMHLEPGWHKIRIVAAGADVKLFLDDAPVRLSKGPGLRGQFGIFSLSALRLKDLTIRP